MPRAARVALAGDVARGLSGERTSLVAMHLDTEDRALARAGIEWRLRREGRRWIQTLRAADERTGERLEHEAIRPRAAFDVEAHAGTVAGDKLADALDSGADPRARIGVRFQTEVRRLSRRIRVRGASVDVTFDQGRMVSDQLAQRVCEVEFRLASGSISEMLRLVDRWRKRFGLVHEPRSHAERGERLAQGAPAPPVRKASKPRYERDAGSMAAFDSVLEECLAQITHNAVGLLEGDEGSRAEYVHQLRVGIRRLRSALRTFDAWTPAPPSSLVDELRALFTALGLARDADVLDSGVAAALREAGAPPIVMRSSKDPVDPAAAIGAENTQGTFLGWLGWRWKLAQSAGDEPHSHESTDDPPPAPIEPAPPPIGASKAFRRGAERRLRRWHARIAAHWTEFDRLDEASLHDLRKRIKRQRYAVEFFAPLMSRRRVRLYLAPLAAIQERMGELNDLFVARSHYQALVSTDPAAWFALGWIAARIELIRSLAKPELARLADADPPRR